MQVLAFASMGTPPTTGTVLKDRPDAPHAKQESLGRPSTVAEMRQNLVLLGCGVARMTRAEMFRAPRGLAVELRRRAPPATDAPSAPQHPSGAIRG